MIMKRRGRKQSTEKQKDILLNRRGNKWLGCSECGEDEWVAKDTATVICGYCVQKKIVPPDKPKVVVTTEEKRLRAERKLERIRLREAKKLGKKVEERTDLGFKRGWKMRRLFKVEVDGVMKYYNFGKEVSKTEGEKLSRELRSKERHLEEKKANARPRGWHFMKEYVAPDGTMYVRGKPVSKKPVPVSKKPVKKGKAS